MALGLISFSIGDNYFYVFIGFIFLGLTQGSAMTIGSTFWPNYFGTKNLGLFGLFQHPLWFWNSPRSSYCRSIIRFKYFI